MSVISALHNRNSHGKLAAPGPDAAQLRDILQAGLRAPDHGRLRPWHFIIVENERRAALGELFARALLVAKPDASDIELAKARSAPLRAPLLIAGLVQPVEHPKVPRVEQTASVACALHGMSLASESLGYNTMWRTGWYAQDAVVVAGLGGKPGDEVVGFLYIGTREGEPKPLPEAVADQYVSFF